jgi:methionyl-tRNA formyltransferase
VEERQQDPAHATYAPKLTPEDRMVDWKAAAEAIARRVRALAPDPAAETTFRAKVLKIFRTSSRAMEGAERRLPAGSVVDASKSRLAVAAGHGIVELEDVALEGRKRMTGAEFVRGYRPGLGEILGSP